MTNVVIFYPSFELKKKVVKILAIWVKLIMHDHKKWMNDNNIKTKHWNFFDSFFYPHQNTNILFYVPYIYIYIHMMRKNCQAFTLHAVVFPWYREI